MSGLLQIFCTNSSTKYSVNAAGRGPADALWDLPAGSLVIIDESGMVDTRLLHDDARIAQAKRWRTVRVGDHRRLDAVDAGGMFAELVHDPDVVSVELDTLHRFEHEREGDASLEVRDGDHAAIDVYDSHGRIHGHLDHAAAVEAVADPAYLGLYLTNTVTRDQLALPADYVADGSVTVNDASTIHRAQGATVDEAHVIISDRTSNRQLCVAATRVRRANHIHTAPPAFDPDQHGPASSPEDWSPIDALAAVVSRQPDATSAIARRRQLRELVNGSGGQNRGEPINDPSEPLPTAARAGRQQRSSDSDASASSATANPSAGRRPAVESAQSRDCAVAPRAERVPRFAGSAFVVGVFDGGLSSGITAQVRKATRPRSQLANHASSTSRAATASIASMSRCRRSRPVVRAVRNRRAR